MSLLQLSPVDGLCCLFCCQISVSPKMIPRASPSCIACVHKHCLVGCRRVYGTTIPLLNVVIPPLQLLQARSIQGSRTIPIHIGFYSLILVIQEVPSVQTSREDCRGCCLYPHRQTVDDPERSMMRFVQYLLSLVAGNDATIVRVFSIKRRCSKQ